MTQRSRRLNPAVPIIATSSLVAGAAVALAWVAYVRRYVRHDLPLTAAMNGELHRFSSRLGDMAFYVSAPAQVRRPASDKTHPMLLIHSVNAAASAYEMKPLFEHYAATRRVFALDLPGFGFSDRLDVPYSPGLYAEAILDFVSREMHSGPVDAVALSLGCEFLALAARAQPKLFRSLTLISPTGLKRGNTAVRFGDVVLRLLRNPAWSQVLFDTLVSRPSLRYFLSLSQRTPVDSGLEDYAYLTSHQPGAKHAPYRFVAGQLFTRNVVDAYRALTQPTLVVHGDDAFSSVDRLDVLRKAKNVTVRDFSDCCKALVQYDNLPRLIQEIDAFLGA